MDQESEWPSLSELGILIDLALRCRDAVVMAMSRAYQRLVQGVAVFTAVVLLLLMATFLYWSFYYSYMPRAAYSTPVHYYHRTDCESSAPFLCSYPAANISLLRNKNQVLTVGQAYQIFLWLEMPDSPANQELGMFMVRMTCYSKEGRVVASSARCTMLRYRSGLLRTLGTLLFLPAFLTGVAEQKQLLQVEIFSEYTDNPYAPSVGAIIQILTNRVQIYSSQLDIHAQFTGIRYLLFNFPLTSALVGVSSNSVFLGVLLLSYMRLLFGAAWSTRQHKESSEREKDRDKQEDYKDGAAETTSLAGTPVAIGSTSSNSHQSEPGGARSEAER